MKSVLKWSLIAFVAVMALGWIIQRVDPVGTEQRRAEG